ncbi:Oidioi.mRNA.OKI2018_I69.chr1.g3513.t1.cds [Oikopleura dioica]|uniref:Oidioi.mRNA.OKI2018_I69.chr1.g3513.t1.cds n=1 Tax=Oikopleura dioica TaxID=34765 RepID=A0ABN7SUY4_OIKDI|nr:Oidioi.mRNA.OKI2018_I69.chr1.g3513.t1.cds [Oikopleura dioica]
MHDSIKFKTKSGSGIVLVSIFMMLATMWLMATTIHGNEAICFAVVGGLIQSVCGFAVGLGKNCKEKRSQECFTKFDFCLMMALTAATILFILFWIHQFFQLGVPDDAYSYMQLQFIIGLLYLPILGSYYLRTCFDDGVSNRPSAEEILAEYGNTGGRKFSMQSNHSRSSGTNSRTKLKRSSSR